MVTMDRIDQMMKEAEAEQGQELAGEHLEEADSFPITGVQLNQASRMVTIYHRETGEPRYLPRRAAEDALRKKYRQRSHPLFGKFVFSPTPTRKYRPGAVKCALHPDNPQRKQYDEWGLPVCTSAHLASPGEAALHLKLRHPSARAVIEKAEADQKAQQQIDSQKAVADAILQALKQRGGDAPSASAPLYQKEPKK